MIGTIIDKLKLLPQYVWIFFGISSITTPIAIVFLMVNSGSVEYKAGDTEINLKGKELTSINSDNVLKLQQQIEQQNKTILELTKAAKEKNLEQKLKPQLKEVEKAVIESEIRLNDVQTSQQQLNDFVNENQ